VEFDYSNGNSTNAFSREDSQKSLSSRHWGEVLCGGMFLVGDHGARRDHRRLIGAATTEVTSEGVSPSRNLGLIVLRRSNTSAVVASEVAMSHRAPTLLAVAADWKGGQSRSESAMGSLITGPYPALYDYTTLRSVSIKWVAICVLET